jgi:hypothetical protein
MICDETADDERADIREMLQTGETQVVVNCDVLSEGIDWPFVSCIGLVRPTKRLRRYLQNAGRGMRAHPGKADCVLIDHAGCVLYHGFPDTDREWPISPDDNVDKKNQSSVKEKLPIRCKQCGCLFAACRTCPDCGTEHIPVRKPRDYGGGHGSLVSVNAGQLPAETARVLYQRYWYTCIAVACKRNRHAGLAAGMFTSKFGIPPWQAAVSPLAERMEWKRPACEVFPSFGQRVAR